MNCLKQVKKSGGFGLIEVLIAAAAMSVVALVLAQIVVDSRKLLVSTHTRTEQDLTASFLGKIITNQTAIVNTALSPGIDTNFHNCIMNTGACQITGTAVPIDFYDANNVHVSGRGTGPIDPTLLTDANSIGTAPVYYDASLAKCTPTVPTGDPTCGIQVFTYYVTSCSGGACTAASSMTIFYIMKQATGVVLAGGNSTYLKPVINETVIALPYSIGGTSNNIVSWQNPSQLGGSPIWTNVTAASVNGLVGVNKQLPTVALDVVGDANMTGNLVASQIDSTGNLGVAGAITASTLTTTGNITSAATVTAQTVNGAAVNATSNMSIAGTGAYILKASPTSAPETALNATELVALVPFTLVGAGLTIASTSGNVIFRSPAVGSFIQLSDQRLKKEIETIPDAEKKLDQLRGVMFTWKKDGRRDMGVIAQEVEKVIPEVVTTDKKGMKAVEYENLVGVLIEGYKESKTRMQAQIDAQDKKNKELNDRLEHVEKLLLELKKSDRK